ncbi:hypothetical protein MMC27_008907 [Xylographa pallens]|nr:hypothetical protein [Xylographa pallens]
MNNFAMPGLNSDDDNLFDFEAASSNAFWPSTHNDLAHRPQTVQDDEATHMMPLTESEIEAIVAMRASNAQNHHQAGHFAPPELPLHTNFSGFEEPGAFGSSLQYDNTGLLLSPNFNDFDDFDVPDYGAAQLNASDRFTPFEQPQSEEAAVEFGALTNSAPCATGQSG